LPGVKGKGVNLTGVDDEGGRAKVVGKQVLGGSVLVCRAMGDEPEKLYFDCTQCVHLNKVFMFSKNFLVGQI